MPFSFYAPPQLTFEQTNPELAGAARAQDLISNAIQQKILSAQAQYAPQQQVAALQKALLMNQYYPSDIQSQINARNAGAGLTSEQAKQIQFQLQNPVYMNPLATLINQQGMSGNGGYTSIPSENTVPMQNQGGNIAQTKIGNSQDQSLGDYGLPNPKLSASATNPILNRVMGISPADQANLGLYTDQKKDQYNKYSADVNKGLDLANSANTFSQNLAAYNEAMNNTELSGGLLGHVPHLAFENAQKADYAANKLLPESIASLRSAMKTGQFTNKDIGIAENANLSRTTNPETRKFYTDYANAVRDRLSEYPQLMNIGKNPSYKIRNEDMNTIWSLYQKQNPIIAPDGKTINAVPKAPLNAYLTPEALKSIRETGTYTPPQIAASKTSSYGNFDVSKLSDDELRKIANGQ